MGMRIRISFRGSIGASESESEGESGAVGKSFQGLDDRLIIL